MDPFSDPSKKKCDRYNPADPSNGRSDIYVQLVLSFALGASAFIGFCVSFHLEYRNSICLIRLVSSPTMENPLCSTEEADRCCSHSARATRQLLRMDARSVQGDGGGSACLCRA